MELPSEMMIARNTSFGPPEVVRVERVPISRPRDNEVLVRNFATTVSAADWRLRSRNVPKGFGVIMGFLFGFHRPRYRCLGTEAAGEVIACGPKVTRFKVGDRVVANLGMKLGGHAQFVLIVEAAPIAKIPGSVTYEDAAALVFGGTTALVFLRDKLRLRAGEQLLVVGAGGAVGSAAVQLGRLMGATVTGVCSTDKIPFVRKLGVDHLIDYRKEDWRPGKAKFDAILDTVGGATFANTRHHLTKTGRLGLVVADLPVMLRSAWNSMIHPQKIFAGPVTETASDLVYMLALCERGQFKPLIGEVFPLNRIVEAHRRVEEGHKLGSLVIEMAPDLI